MSKRFVLCFSMSLGSWNENYVWCWMETHSVLWLPRLDINSKDLKRLSYPRRSKSLTFQIAKLLPVCNITGTCTSSHNSLPSSSTAGYVACCQASRSQGSRGHGRTCVTRRRRRRRHWQRQQRCSNQKGTPWSACTSDKVVSTGDWTRSSAIAERPRDASCHWIFC